jgi:AcrR family transcriptional regulator
MPEARRSPGRPHTPVSRSKLLSIAREVFAERGYGAASLAEVASRAGLRKASLFHHFASKETLYNEALGEMLGDLHSHILEAGRPKAGEGRRGAPKASFVERLDRLSEAMVRYLGAHPPAARLLLREIIDGGPFATGPGLAVIGAVLDATLSFLRSAPSARSERDVRHLALSIIGVHLTYFAAADVSGASLGASVFAPEMVEERVGALLGHVRSLAGARARRARVSASRGGDRSAKGSRPRGTAARPRRAAPRRG